uniref:Uncharacterized protein n=1 Tax=Rhizophora mucronata TaxID=61149 RepID=A0A2P2N830_RHIMU
MTKLMHKILQSNREKTTIKWPQNLDTGEPNASLNHRNHLKMIYQITVFHNRITYLQFTSTFFTGLQYHQPLI